MMETEEDDYSVETYQRALADLAADGASAAVRTRARHVLQLGTTRVGFPEGLWRDWIASELAARGATAEDAAETDARVADLYKMALEQVYAPALWLAYFEHLRGASDSDRWDSDRWDSDRWDSASAQARRALKYDPDAAPRLYALLVRAALAQAGLDPNPSPNSTDPKLIHAKALAQCRQLYRDWLQVPHGNSESVFQEYSQFETRADPAGYEKNLVVANRLVQEARELWAEQQPFERRVAGGRARVDVFAQRWRELQDSTALRQGNTAEAFLRVQNVFSRCSAAHSRSPELWTEWLRFLALHAPKKQRADALARFSKLAVLFCPGSGAVWRSVLRAGPSPSLEDAVTHPRLSARELVTAALGALERSATTQSGDEHWLDFEKLLSICAERVPEALRAPWHVFEARRLLRLNQPRNVDQALKLFRLAFEADPENGGLAAEWARAAGSAQDLSGARAVANRAMTQPRLRDAATLYQAYLGIVGALSSNMEDIWAAEQAVARHRDLASAGSVVNNAPGNEPDAKRPRPASTTVKPPKPAKPELVSSPLAHLMVHVSNLDPRATPEQLAQLFESVAGPVQDVSLWHPALAVGASAPTNPYLDVSRGDPNKAFVELASVEAVATAVKEIAGAYVPNLNDQPAGGLVLTPCVSRNRATFQHAFSRERDPTTVFVRPLPAGTRKLQLRTLFAGAGPIREIRIVEKPAGSFAYVSFRNKEAASRAVELVDGQPVELFPGATHVRLSVAISDPQQRAASAPRAWDGSRTLVVMNLPKTYDHDRVEAFFSEFGAVDRLSLSQTADGAFKGIAFVQFSDAAVSDAALVQIDRRAAPETGKKLKATRYSR